MTAHGGATRRSILAAGLAAVAAEWPGMRAVAAEAGRRPEAEDFPSGHTEET